MNLSTQDSPNIRKETSELNHKLYKSGKGKISKHLKESEIEAISDHLGVSKKHVIVAIMRSLVKLGWKGEFKEHHIFWLRLIRTCLTENSPPNRWEKAKLQIYEFLTNVYKNDPVHITYEIIKNSRIPLYIIDNSKIPDDIIREDGGTINNLQQTTKYVDPSFVEYLLRTIILFNAIDMDKDVPSEVLIDKWQDGAPKFCSWEFCRDGTLFELEFKNGEVKEKFFLRSDPKNDWCLKPFCFEDLYKPSYLLFETDKGSKLVDIKEFLSQWGLQGRLIQNSTDLIKVLFSGATLEGIKKKIEKITERTFKAQEDIEQELKAGYEKAFRYNMARAFFPDYKGNCINYRVRYTPEWNPEHRLLDLKKLKTDLADFHLSRLSKADKTKVFEELVPRLGFELFKYDHFHAIHDKWREEGDHEKIQSALIQPLDKRYPIFKPNTQRTQRFYALLCLKAIKITLETGCPFEQACRVVSQKVKEGKTKLPLKMQAEKIPTDSTTISKRSHDIIHREPVKYSVKQEKDLKILYFKLRSRYRWAEVHI